VGSGPVRSSQIGSGRVGSGGVRSVPVGSISVGSGPIGLGRGGSGQIFEGEFVFKGKRFLREKIFFYGSFEGKMVLMEEKGYCGERIFLRVRDFLNVFLRKKIVYEGEKGVF
jgi:hypothetical protein